jgi:hypothetical protein
METDTLSFISVAWDIFGQSWFFTVVGWFLKIYTIVLFLDIVMLLIVRGVSGNIRTQLYGTDRPIISKNQVVKRWEKIVARLRQPNPSQYKVAVLEADHMADELLAGIGYAGKNMGERLKSIQPGQVESFEPLQKAHATRNRIVNEPDFTVTREEAEELLEAYRKFFVELELF